MERMKTKSSAKLTSTLLIIGITIALFILLILSVGSPLPDALRGFFSGSFGSAYSFAEVLVKAAPLILCGLSISIGFTSGFTNIGAEGQFYMGAAVTTFVGMYFTGLPWFLLLPVSMILGFLVGGIWSMIPGILKAKLGISEVINTIMFNYIAAGIVGILLQTKLKDPEGFYPVSPYMPDGLTLPIFWKGTRLHAGFLVALACAAIVYILVHRTYLGYEMRAVGFSQRASKVAGLNTGKAVILSSLFSGGFAGLAGVCEIAGLQHRLLDGISPGYGYLAIVTALLGNNHPAGIIFASIGISCIQVGSSGMQRSAGVPTAIANIILGGVVVLILMRPFLTRVLKGRRGNK